MASGPRRSSPGAQVALLHVRRGREGPSINRTNSSPFHPSKARREREREREREDRDFAPKAQKGEEKRKKSDGDFFFALRYSFGGKIKIS